MKDASRPLLRPFLLTRQAGWGLFFLAAILASLYQGGMGREQVFNPDGAPLLWRFLAASAQPDLSPEFLSLTLRAALITLAHAVCGTFLSLGVGMVAGTVTSQVWWQAVFPRGNVLPLWWGGRLLLAFPRAIHEAIWGLFFVHLWGLDPLTAILAIAIPYSATVAKIFSEILDDTERQPLLALLNSGVPPLAAFCYGLIPPASSNLISYSFYRFECSLRSAAVLGIVGAGGLGYEMLLSFQSLRYPQLWTLFYAMALLNGTVDASSALLRRRLRCPSRLDLKAPIPEGRRGGGSEPWLLGTLVGAGLLVSFSFWYVGADFSLLGSPRTAQLLADIARQSFPPQVSQEVWQSLGDLSLQTLGMSLLGAALAGLGGILLSFPAAHTFFLPGGLFDPRQAGLALAPWALLLLVRAFLLFCRAVPAPIWALAVLSVCFPGILPGAIALGLHNLGILGRLMAEVNENLERPPLEALKAQGTPPGLVFLYGVLPPTLPRFLSYTLYRWEVCTRETVMVGLVGAGGLGRLLAEQLSSFDYPGVGVTLAVFVALTFLVDWVSGAARRPVSSSLAIAGACKG